MTLDAVQEKNVNNMELREGYGNQPGDLKEKDVINVVHILVSSFISLCRSITPSLSNSHAPTLSA